MTLLVLAGLQGTSSRSATEELAGLSALGTSVNLRSAACRQYYPQSGKSESITIPFLKLTSDSSRAPGMEWS